MRETRHEHYLKLLLLPEEMRRTCSISLSIQRFLSNVQSYLKQIYGNRADWKKNLQKYYESEEYLSKCRCMKNIDDIPEIGVADIKSWIAEEEGFTATINRLFELLPLFDDKDKAGDAYVEAGKLLGLIGSDPSAIYHHIIDFDGITDEETRQISENIRKYPRVIQIAISTLIKLCINGRLVTYPVIETVMQ